MFVVLIVLILALGAAVILMSRRLMALRRQEFIRSFVLPRGLFERLMKRRPELALKDCQLVARALRQFFLAYSNSGHRFVAMPSQVADDLWHEFILYTKDYDAFCRKAFGHFLHHTPAVVLGGNQVSNAGLRRCWYHACVEENIRPQRPTRLPLLFALDAKLNITDGFRYVPDCDAVRRKSGDPGSAGVHCGTHVGSSSGDGGGDSGGASDFGGDSTGGDSGCGGGGCGGGD